MAIEAAAGDLISGYYDAKLELGEWSGASQALLHVHAGLAIFVVSSLVLRRKFRSPIPLALVALFAVGNEVLDWLSHAPSTPMEPVWDVLNTLFWPAILFLLARRWR